MNIKISFIGQIIEQIILLGRLNLFDYKQIKYQCRKEENGPIQKRLDHDYSLREDLLLLLCMERKAHRYQGMCPRFLDSVMSV